MNNKNNFLAAVDIGTTKIVTIVGKKNEKDKLEILGMSKTPSKGVKRGVVLNIEETVNAIRTTVEEVQKQSGVTLSEVFVGIAGQHIKSVRSRGYVNIDSFEKRISKEDKRKLIAEIYKIPIDVG
jgi:cell division protein FtsA